MVQVTTTYLEMTDPSQLQPKHCSDECFAVREATTPQWRFNRFLYEAVGADWQWLDKLTWTQRQWRAYVEDPHLRTFVGYHDGSPAGYFELHEQDGDVQIAYFGLMPAFIGRGLGGALLTSAIEQAWAMNPKRVWVHTCNLDHPAALANYQARGMTIYQTRTSTH